MIGATGIRKPALLGALFAASLLVTSCELLDETAEVPLIPSGEEVPVEETTTTAPEETTTTVAGETTTTAPEETTTTVAGETTITAAEEPVANPDEVSPIELELLGLINELRTEPDGRLKRANDAECVVLDEVTGQAPAAPAVELNEAFSLDVSRVWAEQLTFAKLVDEDSAKRDANPGFELREAVVDAGIDSMAWLEIVDGHEGQATALEIFSEWRDSDTHYCDLMNPTMTGAGVGVSVRDTDEGVGESTFVDLVLFLEN